MKLRFCTAGLYYGITIAIVSMATGCTVLTLNIHHKGIHGGEVPALVRTVCLKFFARVFCMHRHNEPQAHEHVSQSPPRHVSVPSTTTVMSRAVV